ncbi:MAG TPA: ATP-binding protein, partial [Desulfuromonadaceae bacterium]
RTIAEIPAVRHHDAKAVNSLFRELVSKNPQYSNLLIADRTGREWAEAIPVTTPINIKDRRYFQNAMATGHFSSGEYVIGRAQHVPVLNFGYPIKDASGKVSDVVVVVFNFERFNQKFNSKAAPAKTSFLLADHNGIILSNLMRPEIVGSHDRDDLFRRMSEGPERGTFEAISLNGIHRYFAYQQLRLSGEQKPYMYVRAGMPANVISGRTNSRLIFNLGFMSAILFLGIGSAYYISKRGILDKIVTLQRAAQRLADGDLDVRVSDSVSGGEIGELGQSFDAMARKLADDISRRDHMTELLRASEEKFRNLFDNAEIGMVRTRLDGSEVLDVNRKFLEIVGRTREEVLGKPSAILWTDPREREEIARRIIADDRVSGCEVTLFNSQCGVRNCLMSFVLYREQGVVEGTILDITERKTSEELLRASEKLLAEIIEMSPISMAIVNTDGTIERMNRRAIETFGYCLDEVPDINRWCVLAYPDASYREEVISQWMGLVGKAIAENTEIERREYRVTCKEGMVRTMLIFGIPVSDRIFVMSEDITQQKQIEAEMIKAKEGAEAANLAKSQFLSNMSHELRTPMTGVLGMLDLALNGPLDEEQREFLNTAHASAESLLRIINDILDLARVEKGKLTLENNPFSLRECVAGAVDILIPEALRKGLDLIRNVAGNVPEIVMGDQVRLRQVLTNLCGNAVKFTERGKVEIRVTAGAATSDNRREFTFTITDTGIGIPDNKRNLLFKSFSQVDESNTRQYGGTGLGLAISKEIVERMGGTLTFESYEGKGSIFFFSIPLPVSETERESSLAVDSSETVSAHPGTEGSWRILIVEDDPTIRQLLESMLKMSGFETDSAENGMKAVEMWETGSFDLILMDIQMPQIDGFAATRAIREKERALGGGHTIIVAMTAHAFKEDEECCLDAGMDAYISKPIDVKKSIAIISSLIESPYRTP